MPARLVAGLKVLRGDFDTRFDARCPVCDFRGRFLWVGFPPRLSHQCPACLSIGRTRHFWLAYSRGQIVAKGPTLHFAAESSLVSRFRRALDEYTTADLHHDADLALDIEDLALADGSLGTIFCNHVLEHVNDTKALRELHRVLRPHGRLVLSFPIIEEWDRTYENPEVRSKVDRSVHFGQHDHVRFYGRDAVERIRAAGFEVETLTAGPSDCVEYSIDRGDRLFVCTRRD